MPNSLNGHSSNGHSSNGYSRNGHSSNGHSNHTFTPLVEGAIAPSHPDASSLETNITDASTLETNPEDLHLSKDDWSHATKELLDSMPKVWTRGLAYLLLFFAGIVLPWAILSQVDETGTARGRLEPKGQTVRLDAAVSGAIASIDVTEGEQVKPGQRLLTLNADLVEVELKQMQDQLNGQQNQLTQQNLLRNQLITTLATQQQQNQAQALERKTQIDQAARESEHARSALNLTERHVAAAVRELERYQSLYQQGLVPEVEMISYRDILLEREQLYEQAQADLAQSMLQVQERRQSYDSLLHTGKLSLLRVEEELKNLDAQITQLTSDIAQSTRQIESLQLQLKQRIVTAPIEGTVFELPFQQSGAVVQPGSKVVEIAPEGSTLIVNAEMSTTESGSLQTGLPVKLKFDAYPFQDYGIATGTLATISPTSRMEETSQGSIDIYQLEIELDRPCLPSPKACIPLRPGETATVEVIVRQRRVIDIILDPFKKLSKDGLHL